MKPAIEAMKFLLALVLMIWVIVRESVRWAWDLCCLAWVALGEPDARGDAEKDGGGM